MPCFSCWVAGAPRQTPTGRALSGTYSESYWASELEFSSDSGFLEKVIYMVGKLSGVKDNLRDFKASNGKIEIYLQMPGSSNNGGILESELLKRLGDLGVDLLIEVFPGS